MRILREFFEVLVATFLAAFLLISLPFVFATEDIPVVKY